MVREVKMGYNFLNATITYSLWEIVLTKTTLPYNYGKYRIFNPIFWYKFGLKHVIKLILIKSTPSNLFIFSFKIKIQLWKYD